MTADVLRSAASVLRERAQAATPGPWNIDDAEAQWADGAEYIDVDGPNGGWVARTGYTSDAAYIATVSPLVGLALADWLDRIAWTWELDPALQGRVGGDEALAVARAVLGESA